MSRRLVRGNRIAVFPYGYKLENCKMLIAEDEIEVLKLIYNRYIHTNDGINGVAKYLNGHGYKKKI